MKYWISNEKKGMFIELDNIFLWQNDCICEVVGEGADKTTNGKSRKLVYFKIIHQGNNTGMLNTTYNLSPGNHHYFTKNLSNLSAEEFEIKFPHWFL